MSPKPKSLSSDDALSTCLSLLAALTSSATGTVNAGSFCDGLGLEPNQLDSVLKLLQAIADERSGARIAIAQEGDEITLLGDSGNFAALRFTQPEALALNQVLKRCRLADDVRERIDRALGPIAHAKHDEHLLSGDALLGGFYPLIAEAITLGGRLRMSYRAGSEDAPSERLIDPGFIEVSGDAAYLIAWNIEKDAQRSYRLDRIADLELTDDSVVKHAFVRHSAAESLREHGQTAQMRWATKASFEACTWAGIHRDESRVLENGQVEAPVSYTSESWLFDQVLAAGGDIVILDPGNLRHALLDYANL